MDYKIIVLTKLARARTYMHDSYDLYLSIIVIIYLLELWISLTEFLE